MDRIAEARGVGSVRDAVMARISAIDGKTEQDLLRRAYLATATVHRYGMSLGRGHLAALLGLPEEELEARVLKPLDLSLVSAGPSAVRTRHPFVAAQACEILGADEEQQQEIVVALLSHLPGGSVADPTVFHRPSELIRPVRHGQLAPIVVDRFFEAGENAADHDMAFWFDRGRFDINFGRWEAALAHLDRALWRQPHDTTEREHNAAVHAARARCLTELNRKKEALAATEEGLRLSPRDSVLLRLRDKLGGRRRPAGGGGRDGGGRSGGRRRKGGERGERGAGGGPRGGGQGTGGEGGRGARRPARSRPPTGAGR
jgi:tetratricopeptide (TPR) repeat protein